MCVCPIDVSMGIQDVQFNADSERLSKEAVLGRNGTSWLSTVLGGNSDRIQSRYYPDPTGIGTHPNHTTAYITTTKTRQWSNFVVLSFLYALIRRSRKVFKPCVRTCFDCTVLCVLILLNIFLQTVVDASNVYTWHECTRCKQ